MSVMGRRDVGPCRVMALLCWGNGSLKEFGAEAKGGHKHTRVARNLVPGHPGLGEPEAQTAAAGLEVCPAKTSSPVGTWRRCAMPSSDRTSKTAAATKATMAPMNMICPISQKP